MKKKSLILTAVATIGLTAATMAQVPSYVPANGLVGWWPFNGNANDESVNGNNGTVNGATLTADRFGNINQAYGFDGNDWISTNDIGISGITSRSISFWAKTISTSPMGLISFGGNGMFPNNGNRFSCDFNYGAQGVTMDGADCAITYSPINSVTSNSWNFYVFTMDIGNNLSQVKVYQNGILLTNVIYSYFPATNLNTLASTQLQFGRINYPPNNFNFYNGALDDIGIWNRALTACEIQDLYSSQVNSTFVNAGADQTICNGDPVTLSAINSLNYSWDNGVTDGVAFIPTATQNYTVSADSAGCLSTDVVTVTVNENTSATQIQTALDSYTWSVNNQTYEQSGMYTAVIPNEAGCDSTITLDLSMTFTGLEENSQDIVFTLFPNPAQSVIKVKADISILGEIYTIYDGAGRVVLNGKINSENATIELGNLTRGIYFFSFVENNKQTFKVIKE